MSFAKIKTQQSEKKKGEGRTETGPSTFQVNLADFESVILKLRCYKIVLLFLSFKTAFELQKSDLKRGFVAYFSEIELFWAQNDWPVV